MSLNATVIFKACLYSCISQYPGIQLLNVVRNSLNSYATAPAY